LRGIADYARDHTPWSFYWEPGGLEKAWPQLKTLDADGIILRDVEKLDDVLAYGIPAVVVGHSRKEVPGLANVLTDSSSIAAMAADHLIRCGFRHFAFCGLEDAPWSRLRGEAFQAHLDGHGRPTHFYPSPAASAAAGWRAERRTMAEWLASLPKPVGIMTANDDRGEQVIEARSRRARPGRGHRGRQRRTGL
jgi:LacI family transcriptional regulator